MLTYPQHFDLLSYFDGQLRAVGVFEDRFHSCRRKLVVDLFGTRIDDKLKLNEQFYYDDGELQQRTWWIESSGDNEYQGHANDVVGAAVGVSTKAELRWKYKMLLPVGNRKISVSFDDRMYLLPGNTLINRAVIRKWGFVIGTVTLAFHPLDN